MQTHVFTQGAFEMHPLQLIICFSAMMRRRTSRDYQYEQVTVVWLLDPDNQVFMREIIIPHAL